VITATALLALALGASLLGVTPAEAKSNSARCNWPMWGHGIDRTFATTCPGINTQNANDLRRIWFFNTFDVVTATPAVVGDTVYVGDWSGRFYALNRANGHKRWMFKATPHPNVYSGQIVSSAAVATMRGEQTVYFGGGKTLYALRASDGHVRWKHEIGQHNAGFDPTEIEASPVVFNGLVIVGWDVHNATDGRPAGVFALDAATGRERWRTITSPTTGAGATGPGCADVWGSAAIDRQRKLVFVGTGNCVTNRGWGKFSEAIVALGLDDGAVKWTYQPHQPNRDDFDFAGAPNLFEAGGHALVGLGNKDGTYYAIDRDTGKLVWLRHAADPGLPQPGTDFSTGGFIGPTAVADGVVAGGTAFGGGPYLHGMDAATGTMRWQQSEASATYGAAAIANGVLVIGGTDFTMRAIDIANGNVLWSDEVAGAVSGGAVIVGSDVIAVAGIREPGTGKRSHTSGVYRYSLRGRPVTSTSAPPVTTRPGPSTPAGGNQPCVVSTCTVPFEIIAPPSGVTPHLTLKISLDPWKVVVHVDGLGPPSAWVRPGSAAARVGATRFGVFLSESDDSPQGGLLCVIDSKGTCTSKRIPRTGATYNRLSLLAIAESDQLPSPADGVNRLMTTRSFTPPLAPVSGKKGK